MCSRKHHEHRSHPDGSPKRSAASGEVSINGFVQLVLLGGYRLSERLTKTLGDLRMTRPSW